MRRSKDRLSAGFSLVELMVGMVVALIGVLVIMQIFVVSEGGKRTATAGSDAQQNGMAALQTIERDVRMAGYGFTVSGMLACTQINTYDSTASPAKNLGQSLMPVRIVDGGGGNPDTVEVLYSASGTGGVPSSIVIDMPDSSAVLVVDNANGINTGDFVVVAEPGSGKPCSRLATTNVQTQAKGYNVLHNSGQSNYNPPGGDNLFQNVPGGYGAGAKVFNWGSMVNNRYFISASNDLQATDLAAQVSPKPTVTLVNHIVNLQAQYGIAPAGSQSVDQWVNATGSWEAPAAADIPRIKAVRIALVARSALQEKDDVPQPANWSLLQGAETGTLSGDQLKFRYKVYETTIPLRNILWAGI